MAELDMYALPAYLPLEPPAGYEGTKQDFDNEIGDQHTVKQQLTLDLKDGVRDWALDYFSHELGQSGVRVTSNIDRNSIWSDDMSDIVIELSDTYNPELDEQKDTIDAALKAEVERLLSAWVPTDHRPTVLANFMLVNSSGVAIDNQGKEVNEFSATS